MERVLMIWHHIYLAHQMNVTLSSSKWHKLIDFGKQNNWPIAKLMKEKEQQEKHPTFTKFCAVWTSLWTLILEPMISTILMLIGIGLALLITQETFPKTQFIAMIILSAITLILLYCLGLRKTRILYWQKKLAQLATPNIMTGLTAYQVRQIYPLFILTQKQEEWRTALIKTNPKVAQETHLY